MDVPDPGTRWYSPEGGAWYLVKGFTPSYGGMVRAVYRLVGWVPGQWPSQREGLG